MRGEFGFYIPGKPKLFNIPLIIPNTICRAGAEAFGKQLFQADDADMPVDFYIGLTNASLDFDSDLTDAAATEISGNGYARQPLTRDNTDWTIEEINGVIRARSAQVTFTASANWSTLWSRAFITDVVSGTSGLLFCASGPTPAPVQTLSGLGPPVDYRFNLNG